MYEVVKKAAHSRAKRPRSRKAPRHPSGVEPIEPVELVGLSPWVAGRRMVRVWGLAGIDSRAGALSLYWGPPDGRGQWGRRKERGRRKEDGDGCRRETHKGNSRGRGSY
jgi:hypothetical protein